MSKEVPSLLRYQALDSTHIEIQSLEIRKDERPITARFDAKIVPWGLTICGVRLLHRQDKWVTVLPTRTVREPKRFPRDVEAVEFTTHAKRYFDNAVSKAVDEYLCRQRPGNSDLLQHFTDLNEFDGGEK
jgi:hypothetical protein